MQSNDSIFVAGGDTLIGRALRRRLAARGFSRVVAGKPTEPDPNDARAVDALFAERRFDFVFVASGRSGGIALNQRQPATLMLDNLRTTANVVDAAHRHGVKKLVYAASSCVYPRQCAQPMQPSALFSGPVEPTNDAYATAKLAGLMLCDAYRREFGARFHTAIVANGFGPDDDEDPEASHVIPALLSRVHAARTSGAREVVVWGTGRARRDFIFADDMADGLLLVMEKYDGTAPINVGSGTGCTIAEVAKTICDVVNFSGELRFDTEKPDGMPVKLLDSAPLFQLGFRAATPFREAVEQTYRWLLTR